METAWQGHGRNSPKCEEVAHSVGPGGGHRQKGGGWEALLRAFFQICENYAIDFRRDPCPHLQLPSGFILGTTQKTAFFRASWVSESFRVTRRRSRPSVNHSAMASPGCWRAMIQMLRLPSPGSPALHYTCIYTFQIYSILSLSCIFKPNATLPNFSTTTRPPARSRRARLAPFRQTPLHSLLSRPGLGFPVFLCLCARPPGRLACIS